MVAARAGEEYPEPPEVLRSFAIGVPCNGGRWLITSLRVPCNGGSPGGGGVP